MPKIRMKTSFSMKIWRAVHP